MIFALSFQAAGKCHEFRRASVSRAGHRSPRQANRDQSQLFLGDFDGWLLERLAVKPGEHVLDVGCGTGAQSLPFAGLVGSNGSVSSLDISADSIATLKSKIPSGAHVQAVASDMADLARVIADTFTTKRYTLAQSSYALYY